MSSHGRGKEHLFGVRKATLPRVVGDALGHEEV